MPNPTIVGIARVVNARKGKFSNGFEWRAYVGPEEQMQLTLHPDNDGTYSIKSPDGTEWFSFNPDGTWGWRPDEPGQPGPWEKFTKSTDQPGEMRLISVHDPTLDFMVLGDFPTSKPTVVLPSLSIKGIDWQDAGRLFVPRYCGMLSALRPERSEADWQRYIDWALQAGFNGVRVFAGALEWAQQSADGACSRLPSFLALLEHNGLACQVTAVTDSATGYDWRDHLRTVLDLCRNRPSVTVEAANEVGHGTQAADLTFDNIRAVLNESTWDALVVACGAPVGVDEPDPVTGRFIGYGGDYMTAHLDRGRDFWNQCRRVRELFANVEAEDVPCLDNEPLGAAEKDGSETGKQRSNEPPFFAVLGALDRSFPGVGGVHHNDAGLDVLLPGPVQQSCAEAYVAAHLSVDACLPGVAGRYYNAGHEGSPVARYTDEQWDHEIIRHYSFTEGTRGASVVVGLKNPNLKLAWQNGWQPTSSAPVFESIRANGERMQVWEIAQ